MSARKPVLGDHKRVKSRLITPFNDMFGPMHDVSWVNTIIPEFLWLVLMHKVHGDHRAVEIATAFTRDVRSFSAVASDTIWAAAGKYAELPEGALSQIVAGKEELYADDMRAALAPLAAWYPPHPLNGIFGLKMPEPHPSDLHSLKQTVANFFDRSERLPMMAQATAIWLAFDANRLKVSSNLALAQFPKIEEYPASDISMRVGASIRSTLNMMFGDQNLMASSGDWPVAFWNRGLELEPCEGLDATG